MKLNSWIELFNLGISNNEKCVLTPSSQKELLNYLLFPSTDVCEGSIMQKVASIFDLELEEDFTVVYKESIYTAKFTDGGIFVYGASKKLAKDMLLSLLTGKAVITDELS